MYSPPSLFPLHKNVKTIPSRWKYYFFCFILFSFFFFKLLNLFLLHFHSERLDELMNKIETWMNEREGLDVRFSRAGLADGTHRKLIQHCLREVGSWTPGCLNLVNFYLDNIYCDLQTTHYLALLETCLSCFALTFVEMFRRTVDRSFGCYMLARYATRASEVFYYDDSRINHHCSNTESSS